MQFVALSNGAINHMKKTEIHLRLYRQNFLFITVKRILHSCAVILESRHLCAFMMGIFDFLLVFQTITTTVLNF